MEAGTETKSSEGAPDSLERQRKLARQLLRLGSKHAAERWIVQTELRQSLPVPIELLMPQLVRLARVRRQSPFLLLAGLFAAFILMIGLLLVFDARFGRASHLPVLLAGLISIILMVRRWQGLRGAAARAIDHFNDVRVAGPLLMALDDSSRESRLVAREVLLNLLPRMRAIHTAYLAEVQRARLIVLLDGDDAPLAIAALRALTYVGDERTLTRIRPLAAGEGLAANHPQVRDVAQNCLSEIKARQTRQRLS